MTYRESRARRLARTLIRVAAQLMPERRTEWARAMHSEFQSLEDENAAVRWAIGCVTAAIQMRVNEMIAGSIKNSKWVFAAEMVLCFVPLTLFWLLILFDGSINPDVLRQYFDAPDGMIVLAYTLSMAVLGVCGPLGLGFAIRYIALDRNIGNPNLGIALVAALLLLGVVYVGTTLVLGGPGRPLPWLGGVVLFVILPVVGAEHLRHLGWKMPARQPTA